MPIRRAGRCRRAGSSLPQARLELFVAMAKEAACTVAHVADRAAVPAAVADYLARENLPAKLRMAPDAAVAELALVDAAAAGDHDRAQRRQRRGLADAGAGGHRRDRHADADLGPERPTTLNFLPETHIVVLTADQVVGGMEEAWGRLRERYGRGVMPRTVNLVTGPSRSADIEQTLQMGAHGPRRLHIILVDGEATAEP